MATSLNLNFEGSDSKKLSLTYPYADATAQAADIKTLMDTIVTNGEIFSEPPLSVVDAKFIDRTVTPITLPEA